MGADGETLNQRARAVGEVIRQFNQILFTNGQIFAKAAVLVNAIQRDVLTAVGFSFPAGCASAARNTGNNAIALADLRRAARLPNISATPQIS